MTNTETNPADVWTLDHEEQPETGRTVYCLRECLPPNAEKRSATWNPLTVMLDVSDNRTADNDPSAVETRIAYSHKRPGYAAAAAARMAAAAFDWIGDSESGAIDDSDLTSDDIDMSEIASGVLTLRGECAWSLALVHHGIDP